MLALAPRTAVRIGVSRLCTHLVACTRGLGLFYRHHQQRPRYRVDMASDTQAAQQQETEEYVHRWEKIWSEGLQPGQRWDKGECAPVLLSMISSGKIPLKGASVFIPGCGRGYDVVAFRDATPSPREVVGLELSATAAQRAGDLVSAAATSAERSEQSTACIARVECGDFFHHTRTYDIGYDYTFGCAMHPTSRQEWAAAWGRAVKPGGTLITLVFPVDANADPNVGPPFPVSPELYTTLLTQAGFALQEMEPVARELSHEDRQGKEFIALWRKL